jgi:hypothetical protein
MPAGGVYVCVCVCMCVCVCVCVCVLVHSRPLCVLLWSAGPDLWMG